MYEIYVQLHLQNKCLVIIPYIIPMYPILWVLPVPFIKVRMDCLPTVKQGFGNSKSIIINNQLNSIYNSVYDFMVLLGKTSFLAHPPVYTIFAQKMTNKTHTQQLQVTDLPIETVLPSTFPGDSVARLASCIEPHLLSGKFKRPSYYSKYMIQRYPSKISLVGW